MKLKSKLKLLAASVAIGFAASAGAAPIDNGGTGNGSLFFNIWDVNGSYSRNLGTNIDSFEASVAAAGNVDLSWAADSALTSWLGTANTATLEWNIMALDASGNRRFLNTYTEPTVSPTTKNDVVRSAVLSQQTFLNGVNPSLASSDSATFTSADPGYAGTRGNSTATLINFSNSGTLANNSLDSGLGFLRINALASGIANSVYNPYVDNAAAVKSYLDAGNTLHLVAAVPEPETYGMLAAGLLMLGAVARRRRA